MSLVKECMYVSVILILLVFCYTGCERNTTNIDALNSVVDSLQKSKDVLKRETSKTAVLKLTYNELKNIHVADSTSIGKLKLNQPVQSIFNCLPLQSIEVLPINQDHILEILSLSFHHRDPFDRLIIAQASIENMPIISCDTIFDSYPIVRIWQ